MEAVIDEALGDVHGLHAFFGLQFVAENDFVHAGRGVGQVVGAFEALADVVSVEDGVFGGLAQAVGTVGQDVRERANEHAEISVERADPPHGLRTVVVEGKGAIGFVGHDRLGQERLERVS